jgi:hypothetical protein
LQGPGPPHSGVIALRIMNGADSNQNTDHSITVPPCASAQYSQAARGRARARLVLCGHLAPVVPGRRLWGLVNCLQRRALVVDHPNHCRRVQPRLSRRLAGPLPLCRVVDRFGSHA